MSKEIIGICGAGAMGSGIAQVAATFGHSVIVYDNFPGAIDKSKKGIEQTFNKLVEKQKISISDAATINSKIKFTDKLPDLSKCNLIIEAIIEDLEIKKKLFSELENLVDANCILASNTSSLSIASISAACKNKSRVIGIHFFNPVPLMPLVEIIPSITTANATTEKSKAIIDSWKKVTVITKDTPGFIVNRVARPFYSESIRIYEEGYADFATIDWAMKEYGGFKMGPFELMDFIGSDVNYRVTESVWQQFFYEPRFKPSLTQKRLFEAGLYGKKSGRGYYDYSEGATMPEPNKNPQTGTYIFVRVISMLINEAIDSYYLGLASKEDLDLAMTKGVNYPKGLIQWGNELGLKNVYDTLMHLYNEYNEDRYRPCVLLKRLVAEGKSL
jgi:3-hydroxybutyryl-CoA dehydrogenase